MCGVSFRRVIAVLLAVLVLVAVSGCLASEGGTTQVQSEAPAFTMTADQLYAEYAANQVAADQKYKDQVVSVSGPITDIGKDISDTAYVVIGGTDSLDGVQCFFSSGSESQVAAMSKGQSITVKGRVQGKVANIVLQDSVLQ